MFKCCLRIRSILFPSCVQCFVEALDLLARSADVDFPLTITDEQFAKYWLKRLMAQGDSLDCGEGKRVQEESFSWEGHVDVTENALIRQHYVTGHAALFWSAIPNSRDAEKRFFTSLHMAAQAFEVRKNLVCCFVFGLHTLISEYV